MVTDGGRLAYNTREAHGASGCEWASTLASLADGVPIWFRGRESVFALDIAVWAAALALALVVRAMRSPARRFADRGRLLTVVTAVHIVAAMLAVVGDWRMHGSARLLAAPAELDILRGAGSRTARAGVQVSPPAS